MQSKKKYDTGTTKSLQAVSRVLLLTMTMSLLAGGLPIALGQSLGAGTIEGTVTDATGAVVPGASVAIENRVTGYIRTTRTDANGPFRFDIIPPNNYALAVSAQGFGAVQQTVDVRSSVP